MKRLTINLSEELHKRLKLHCVLTDQEMAEIIRRLIEDYLEQSRQKTEEVNRRADAPMVDTQRRALTLPSEKGSEGNG